MNVFTFSGTIGKDCEVKVTKSGMSVCSFSVANNTGFGDNKKTTWLECALFGKKAEGGLPQYLVKGAKVIVSGEVCMDEFEGKNGKVKTLKVNVNSIDLIGDKAASKPVESKPQEEPFFDDEIPF
eukprot:GHVR01072313.1.p1 GENE.GHVR01072313.1~~GHVR01072313.1.p1  ORF type:complete len:125 (+),score=10.65 GHVR01072313.1:73-447(+)